MGNKAGNPKGRAKREKRRAKKREQIREKLAQQPHKPRHYKTAREILSQGLGVFARLVEVSEAEHNRIELFLYQRVERVRQGSHDPNDWACLVTGLLEAMNVARAVADDLQRTEMIREVKGAAKLYDMLRYHFQETGEILQENLDSLQDTLVKFAKIKRCGAFNREDLIKVVQDIEDNFKDRIFQLFDGEPKSGIIEITYEQPEVRHAAC